MAFRSLASLYNFVCALNLAQLALGTWTMHSFEFKETGEAQLMLMFVALYTLAMMYLLTKYQRHAEHRLLHVRENIIFLVFMVSFWFCDDFSAAAFLVVRAASCLPSRFLSLHCSPLVLGLLLPLVDCAISPQTHTPKAPPHNRLSFLLTSYRSSVRQQRSFDSAIGPNLSYPGGGTAPNGIHENHRSFAAGLAPRTDDGEIRGTLRTVEQAIQMQRELVGADPSNYGGLANILDTRANVLCSLGRHDEALRTVSEAEDINRRNSTDSEQLDPVSPQNPALRSRRPWNHIAPSQNKHHPLLAQDFPSPSTRYWVLFSSSIRHLRR
ncbi:hypothetical protein B0H14DRAFT_3454257 [Mycena olivaceomarginata]|nr:hypothetical protein B0H14DRAFT_3454257 [Mycena olivaceomarginata]